MRKTITGLTLAATTTLAISICPAHADEIANNIAPVSITPNSTSAVFAKPEVTTTVGKIATMKKVKKKGNGFLRRMLEPVTDLQSQSLKLQEQIVKLEQPIENLQPPMIKLQERVLSVEGQLSEVQKNLGDVREELKSVHGTISGVSAQITRLEEPIGALHEPVARLYKPIADLGTPMESLHTQLDKLRGQMTSLQGPVTALNAPITALNGPVSELVAPVKSLHDPLTGLQADLGELKLELTDLKQSINRIGVYLLVAISLTGLFASIGIPVAIFLAWAMFSKRSPAKLKEAVKELAKEATRDVRPQQKDYIILEKELAVPAAK
jgi:peptidoglycan hydrolase CwlO-like protein